MDEIVKKFLDEAKDFFMQESAVPFKVGNEEKYGDLLEDVCCPQYNSGFFKVIKESLSFYIEMLSLQIFFLCDNF